MVCSKYTMKLRIKRKKNKYYIQYKKSFIWLCYKDVDYGGAYKISYKNYEEALNFLEEKTEEYKNEINNKTKNKVVYEVEVRVGG